MSEIEPVTDEDYRAFTAVAFYPISLGVAAAIEQDRHRVAERQAPEIERLRAEVAQADADYNDAVTLAQMNLDLLKAAEAEVAALKAACGQKDGALGICRLARLGLRVEGAPTCVIGDFDDAAGLSALARTVYFANGKRVALVVLEDSK